MGSKRNERMFNIAEAVAQLSEFPRVQIGAVVTRKQQIVSVGINREKSHPLQKKFNRARALDKDDSCHHNIHAEIDALTKLKRGEDTSKLSIYVFRRNGEGELAMSRPCPACLSYISSLGVKHINYTTDGGYASEQLIN